MTEENGREAFVKKGNRQFVIIALINEPQAKPMQLGQKIA